MCKLTYEELVLLDNLIYLDFEVNEDDKLINIVDSLLNNNNRLDKIINDIDNCIVKMSKTEWTNILKQIKSKSNLEQLRFKNVESTEGGIKCACFVDEVNNTTVVFKGTTTIKEWEDNGQGAYEYDTIEQLDALNYINKLKYDNITVTGHSKGGNKAQYVTVLSNKIDKCVSVNGQGFSNEFIEKYIDKINENKSKIISISSKYDYVNCLFNTIAGESIYIQTEYQINPIYYHKPNILLDNHGALRPETKEGIFSKIIQYFSIALISSLAEEIKLLIIDIFISVIEFILCKEESKEKFLKIAGEKLIMICSEDCYKNKEIFISTYVLLQALCLPLIFWFDFINIEETKSKELFAIVLDKIKFLGNSIIKRMEIIDKDSQGLSGIITKHINDFIIMLNSEGYIKIDNL